MTNQTRSATMYGSLSRCRPTSHASGRRKKGQMLLFRRWLSRRPAPRFVRHVG